MHLNPNDLFPISRVSIGDGAIIGTGSVVTKDIAPYEIVGGSPEVIRKRFDDETIHFLLQLKGWESPIEKVE